MAGCYSLAICSDRCMYVISGGGGAYIVTTDECEAISIFRVWHRKQREQTEGQ